MSNFESEFEFGTPPEAAGFVEKESHLVTPHVFEIDLMKPDRAHAGFMWFETGVKESKLVAEIEGLDDRIGIIYIDSPNVGSYVVLLSTATGERAMINPGTAFDLDNDGGCVISVDKSGNRIYVYSETEDWQYLLHADEVSIADYERLACIEAMDYEESQDDPSI